MNIPFFPEVPGASAPLQTATVIPFRLRYSPKQVAQLLDFSERTLARRVTAKEITPVRDGGRVYFTHEEIVRYAKKSHKGFVVSE